MEWKNSFEKNKEIVFVTSSKDSKPNANVVVSLGFVGERILIADCQMIQSRTNLEENSNICLLSRDKSYYRITGKVEVLKEGEIFDRVKREEKDYSVYAIILVSIKEVFDLDKCKMVFKNKN